MADPDHARGFFLVPFPGEGNGPDVRIAGTISRQARTLSLGSSLLGNLSEISLPAPAESPGRRDRLWEDTCLEIFLGEKGAESYWEINLSPAGHWNVYRFTSYRKGMREEPAFPSLPFRIRTEPDAILFSLDLDIDRIISTGTAIEAGVCAVVVTVAGRKGHWALLHPGPNPDFHRRDGFTLRVPAE